MPAFGIAAEPPGLTGVGRIMQDVEIAVIGGGAAGIAAARTLADAGKSVLLLEASDRLGGRAHTVTVAGMRIGHQPQISGVSSCGS